jgi:hypothetical protein
MAGKRANRVAFVLGTIAGAIGWFQPLLADAAGATLLIYGLWWAPPAEQPFALLGSIICWTLGTVARLRRTQEAQEKRAAEAERKRTIVFPDLGLHLRPGDRLRFMEEDFVVAAIHRRIGTYGVASATLELERADRPQHADA